MATRWPTRFMDRRGSVAKSPFDLVHQVAALLDELAIPYVVGGSIASSLFGEPRTTVDVDIAIEVLPVLGVELVERASADFYVPKQAAMEAIAAQTSFNLVDTKHGLKVDLFVLGDGLLDEMQMKRRVLAVLPGRFSSIWVTSPEDQVLRKLAWFTSADGVSDRQWRDVVGILRTLRTGLDLAYLTSTAERVGLADVLDDARVQACM